MDEPLDAVQLSATCASDVLAVCVSSQLCNREYWAGRRRRRTVTPQFVPSTLLHIRRDTQYHKDAL